MKYLLILVLISAMAFVINKQRVEILGLKGDLNSSNEQVGDLQKKNAALQQALARHPWQAGVSALNPQQAQQNSPSAQQQQQQQSGSWMWDAAHRAHSGLGTPSPLGR